MAFLRFYKLFLSSYLETTTVSIWEEMQPRWSEEESGGLHQCHDDT